MPNDRNYPLQYSEYLIRNSSEDYGSLNAYFPHVWLLAF